MKDKIRHIKFADKVRPDFFFEIVRIEELLKRQLDHDIFTNHLVKFYIIFFVTEGEGQHKIDFVNYKYQKGTVLLIRQDQIQKFFESSNVKGYLLIFTEEFIVGHLNRIEAHRTFQLFNETLNYPKIELNPKEHQYPDFVNEINQIQLEYKYEDEYSLGISRSVFHVIITKLFRIKAKSEDSLVAKKYLEEFLIFQHAVEKNCFSNKKVIVYAESLGWSPKTLNNIVQSVANKTAKTLINEIAIKQIKRLLIGTNQPTKEIAYSAGFDDPANFFKYFKKHTGSSPEVFRKIFH